MGMPLWSTDAVNQRERFSFYRDVACKTLFNISPEKPSEFFNGHIRARSSGPFRFAICETSGYENIRSQRDINHAPADHYTIYLQLRGETRMNQRDESFAFRRNDIFVSDGRYPFRAGLSDDGHRAMAMIPRALIDWRIPWLHRRPLYRLDSVSPYMDLARGHFLHLVSSDLTDIQTSLLTENLCNLLALANTDVAPNRLQGELQLEALLVYCRQNLRNPELTPHSVADHFKISLRTFHLRFQKLGQTFGSWLLAARLNACSKALQDPGQRAINISDIAFNFGFNDLSHFNKSFRTRFGMTPGEWRHEHVLAS